MATTSLVARLINLEGEEERYMMDSGRSKQTHTRRKQQKGPRDTRRGKAIREERKKKEPDRAYCIAIALCILSLALSSFSLSASAARTTFIASVWSSDAPADDLRRSPREMVRVSLRPKSVSAEDLMPSRSRARRTMSCNVWASL